MTSTTDNNENTPKEVDVNTDNLDDFNDLLHGQAEPSEAENDAQDNEEIVEEENSQEELDTSEDDPLATDEQEISDDGDDEEAGEEPEEPETSKPKKKTVQDRINEITAARREAEREASAEREARRVLEERIAKLEKGDSENVGKTQKSDTNENEENENVPHPDAKDKEGNQIYPLGEFDPNFIRDLTRFTIRQETEAAQAEQVKTAEQTKLEEAHNELNQKWETKLVEAEETHEGFRESITQLEDTFKDVAPEYGQYLSDTIMSSEYGTDILYHLSQNLDEAQSIVDAGATGATLALGRLEAQFIKEQQGQEQKSTKKVTKASAPPMKRTRGNSGGNSLAADTDDLDAFEKQFFQKRN